MEEKDLFAERGRSLEEEYFRKREKELIEKMRQHAEAGAERRRLGEQAGVADEEILQDLQALGYTPETVTLLHVVPLVQMAWAEGDVSDRERDLIQEAARARGIAAGSAADQQLSNWLARRPSDDFFEKTLRAIGAVLEAQPAETRAASQKDLLSYCTAIASASGGILGFRTVSDQERQLLSRISQEFEKSHGPRRP
ncbi:MAG TPA: hypothetical protein VH701_03995 [Vicinamibacterales bacterium]